MKQFKTSSVEETINVANSLGKSIKRGDVVCLNGELGTGKTAFVKGIAQALGVNDYITSPTFTIVNEYTADIPMYHFDVYRIADSEEMLAIGFDEYLAKDGVIIIEWAELIEDILPNKYILVEINKNLDEGLDVRIINISFVSK